MILAAALSLSLQLVRTSFDMLDGVSVEVVVHNDAKRPVAASFPNPAEYSLDLLRRDDVLWTTVTPPLPNVHFPPHTRVFMPGPTVLAVYVWNGLTKDGSVPAAGTYVWRAKLLDASPPSDATARVRFIDAVPIAAVDKLNEGDEVTIAGTLTADGMHLADPSGTIPLMKRIVPNASGGTVVVRGYILTRPDRTRAFYVKRWGMML